MKKISYILGGLIVFLLILTLGYNLGKNQGYQLGQQDTETKYQQKIEEVFPTIPQPEEIYFYSGEITEIEGKTITLKASVPRTNPLAEEKFEIKKVNVKEATEIVKRIERTPEEMGAPTTPEEMIEPFKEEEISFSDLKVGNEIIVSSESNIKGVSEFTASKVIKI